MGAAFEKQEIGLGATAVSSFALPTQNTERKYFPQAAPRIAVGILLTSLTVAFFACATLHDGGYVRNEKLNYKKLI